MTSDWQCVWSLLSNSAELCSLFALARSFMQLHVALFLCMECGDVSDAGLPASPSSHLPFCAALVSFFSEVVH